MWRGFCLSVIVSFLISLLLFVLFVPVLKRLKAGQPVLSYVGEHKSKSGTPTMAGLLFVTASFISYSVLTGFSYKITNVIIAFTIGFMLVGFMDDMIKIKNNRNLGLKAYQKIIFQLSLSVIAGIFCYVNGLTEIVIPFSYKSFDLGKWVFVFVPFVFLATTNSVNLLDGLDGLCGSVTAVYLFFFSAILLFESNLDMISLNGKDVISVINYLSCVFGALLAFLIFNQNKASVFMGDTGSLALGGVVATAGIFSGNSFYIILLGFIYVVTALSVLMLVLYYKKTKRRIFKMAPLHHHFQMSGFAESKIAYCYSLITFLAGVCIICFFVW